VVTVKKSYDFSKAKKNPYAKRPKRRITIPLGRRHHRVLQ